jgi:DNA-binding MarR family transcriptional regulator
MNVTFASARLAAEIERLFSVVASRRTRFGSDEASALTTTQRLALFAIADHGPVRLGVLAERIGTTDATATRTVDALAAAGLAERTADAEDRRAVRVAVTRSGRSLVRRRRKQLVDLLSGSLAGIPQGEQERFVALLSELNDVLVGADLPPRDAAGDPARVPTLG